MVGSLSRPQYLSPPAAGAPNMFRTCCTHGCWKLWSAAMLAAFTGSQAGRNGAVIFRKPLGQGSLLSTLAPATQPLPASKSAADCAPQSATEKLQRLSFPLAFATEPTIGMVRNGSAAPFFVVWTTLSMYAAEWR